MRLINVGFGNMLCARRVVAVVNADSAPVRRSVQDARDEKRLIDCTAGRRVRAVIVLDDGHVAVSALQPETLAGRLQSESEGEK